MTIDLDLDEQQESLIASVRGLCGRWWPPSRRLEAGTFPSEAWAVLAELGVLGMVTRDVGGGAIDLAAAVRELGRFAFPGPLAATVIASQVLPGAERAAVTSGTAVVSVGTPPLLPWAPFADLFVELDGPRAWLASVDGEVEAVDTLAGETWGRAALVRLHDLGDVSRGLALGDVTIASYLVGAGEEAVRLAAEYARGRVQFGRPIGDFQAVAHPLADCVTRLVAAGQLALGAAFSFDHGGDAPRDAAVARLSATRAALEAVYATHQTFGAMGFTVEGPIGRLSQQVRQVSLLPPGPNRARALIGGATLFRTEASITRGAR